jgi:UDPglucose 6-dehydrogenase
LGNLRGKTIGLLGLAFKPNTDDMREAPSAHIAHILRAAGAHVRAYDPVAMEVAARVAPEVKLEDDPYALAEGCDALVVLTEWNEFKHLDLVRIRELMNQPVLIDGRNIYDPAMVKEAGFYYRGVGRGYGGQETQ